VSDSIGRGSNPELSPSLNILVFDTYRDKRQLDRHRLSRWDDNTFTRREASQGWATACRSGALVQCVRHTKAESPDIQSMAGWRCCRSKLRVRQRHQRIMVPKRLNRDHGSVQVAALIPQGIHIARIPTYGARGRNAYDIKAIDR